MQISILGAELGTGNLGVSALAAGGVSWLASRYPEAVISFVGYAKEESTCWLIRDGKRQEITVLNIRFSKRLHLSNNISTLLALAWVAQIVPYGRLRDWLIGRNSCLQRLQETDLFAALSGGDSFSDIYGIMRLLYVALPQLLVIALGKRLVLLPQTLGPFRSRTARVIARYILERADRVYSRDYRGLDDVRALTRGGRVVECKFGFDLGFSLEPAVPEKLDIHGLRLDADSGVPLVGLNVSGLLLMGGYTRDNAFGLRTDYESLVYDLIKFLILRKDANVLLIPHVLGPAAGAESDAIACERVYGTVQQAYRGRLGILRGTYDQHEIKHVIGRCEFFIGSRMHACIAALSQHVPSVSIAYSDKFRGVLETIGVEALVADGRSLDSSEIIDAIDRAYEGRAAIRSYLRDKMATVRESAATDNALPDPQGRGDDAIPGAEAMRVQG
jgi:polysaccharide pyruvyl transferase WcaK-like protein